MLPEDPILLPERIDHVFLVAVHPASGREYEEAQSVGHSLRLLGEQLLAPTLFRRFVNRGRFVAPYDVRAVRPREPVEAVVRFETPAGRQGQVDFATFTLPWGRRHALVVVLSHSRLLWLRFYRRQTMAVLTEGLERAFARFGGVPKELLFDQMRAVVLSDGRVGGGELVLNAEFLRVAAHWGFHPRACRPYRAQTKGKVERPIRYIRDSFFYGRAFANDEDLNEQASRWLEGTANVRRHSTTGERPVDRFERDEREALGPLARRPYQRFGVQPATDPTRRRVPNTVKVERRSLRVYAEAAG